MLADGQEHAMNHAENVRTSASHLLRFRSLFNNRRGLAFPCDERGRVDLDALSDRTRNNYLFARAVIGREFFWPEIEPAVA
jgi:hypothetical protein